MTGKKAHRSPRLPHFAALDQLAPGVAFNPYRLFAGWSIRKAIATHPKLRPGAKLVWLVLADQCHEVGYDRHSQSSLAELVGLSVDRLQVYLDRLKRNHLIHVEHELGKQNFTWLLYHPLFALCSPLTHRETAVGGTAEPRQGVPRNRGTQRNYSEEFIRGDGGTEVLPSSSGRAGTANGRRAGEVPSPSETPGESFRERRVSQPAFASNGVEPATPEQGLPSTPALTVRPDASRFWYALTPNEKRSRLSRGTSILQELAHFAGYLADPSRDIQRQARHEIARRKVELSELGFYLKPNTGGNT